MVTYVAYRTCSRAGYVQDKKSTCIKAMPGDQLDQSFLLKKVPLFIEDPLMSSVPES